jgi:hypothetical protein
MVGVLVMLLITGCTQATPEWTKLYATDFPAKVMSIEFPYGKRIGAGEAYCFDIRDGWCATFGTTQPVAVDDTSNIEKGFLVKGLVCENKVEANQNCTFGLYSCLDEWCGTGDEDFDGYGCMLYLGDKKPFQTGYLGVKCPDVVRMAR